jgi:hypothetical protein
MSLLLVMPSPRARLTDQGRHDADLHFDGEFVKFRSARRQGVGLRVRGVFRG